MKRKSPFLLEWKVTGSIPVEASREKAVADVEAILGKQTGYAKPTPYITIVPVLSITASALISAIEDTAWPIRFYAPVLIYNFRVRVNLKS